MNAHTLDAVLVTARQIRERISDRDAQRCALRDDGTLWYDAAERYEDLFDASVDDLCQLLESIESLKHIPLETTAVQGSAPESASPLAAASLRGSRYVIDGWAAADEVDDARFVSDDDLPGSNVDSSDSDEKDQLPLTLGRAKVGELPPVFAAGADREAYPTLAVRIPADSDEYRSIFDAKGDQIVVAAGKAGARLVVLHGAVDEFLAEELDLRGPVFVCLSLTDFEDRSRMIVVSGLMVELDESTDDIMIRFADGIALYYYEIKAIRIG